jgi:hypothetical protein
LIRPLIPIGGKPFSRIEFETKDFISTGEIDYQMPDIMYDLKRTKNFDYWNKKSSFLDFFQAFYYPYVWHKLGNEIPIFKYVVFSHELKLTKIYTVKHPEILFDKVESIINRFVNEPFFDGNTTVCNDTGYGTCNYLDYCDEGKAMFTQESIITEETLM